jgi:hypothetical protein
MCLFYLHDYNSIQYQASRFRSLSGTMTPPDDSRKAEIYVEVRLQYYSYILYINVLLIRDEIKIIQICEPSMLRIIYI